MPTVRVVTTADCPRNLHIGNQVFEPGEDREIDMNEDDLALVSSLGPALGVGIGDPAVAPTEPEPAPAAPTE